MQCGWEMETGAFLELLAFDKIEIIEIAKEKERFRYLKNKLSKCQFPSKTLGIITAI